MKHLLLSIVLLQLAACGGALNYQLKGSELSPGADARLKAAVEPNRKLTRLEIAAENLSPAERLADGATTYVVWARPDFRTPWTRLGALDLSDGGRTGSATLTYSEIDFELLVTAEPNPAVSDPSKMQVFKQHVGGTS